jgi:hypothetical protein
VFIFGPCYALCEHLVEIVQYLGYMSKTHPLNYVQHDRIVERSEWQLKARDKIQIGACPKRECAPNCDSNSDIPDDLNQCSGGKPEDTNRQK